MANLVDTLVQGDLKVTNKLYGNELLIHNNSTMNTLTITPPTGASEAYMCIDNSTLNVGGIEHTITSTTPSIELSRNFYHGKITSSEISCTYTGVSGIRIEPTSVLLLNNLYDTGIQFGSNKCIGVDTVEIYNGIVDFVSSLSGSTRSNRAIQAKYFIGDLDPNYSADSAYQADNDANGNNIVSTYLTNSNAFKLQMLDLSLREFNFDTHFDDEGIYVINAMTTSTHKPQSGPQILLVFNYTVSASGSSVKYQISLGDDSTNGYAIMARRRYADNSGASDGWTSWKTIKSIP